MVRATAMGGLVRAFAINSTRTVAELSTRHGTDPAVTAALGRLATGTVLFGAMLKEDDQANSDAEAIATTIRDLPHPTAMLRSGDSPEAILERIFSSGLQILESKPVRFHCPCSKERAERALMLLGTGEIREIIQADREKGATEVTCHFCMARYEITIGELEALFMALN